MTARIERLPHLRCLDCAETAASLVGGRCARCLAVLNGQTGDWRFETRVALVRDVRRHDGALLQVTLEPINGQTLALARERFAGEHHEARLGIFDTLPQAVAKTETFARRWVEHAPGTSVATYVTRPLG